MKLYQKIIIFIKWSLFFFVLYFVGKTLIFQILKIDWSTIQFDWKFLSLTLLFEIFARFFIGILYVSLLNMMQASLPFMTTLSISWISLLGKYVPGKLAVITSTVYFFTIYKIRPAISTVVPILGNIIIIWVALMLSVPLFFSAIKTQIASFFYITVIIIVGMGIICLHPSIFLKFGNIFLKKMGKSPVEIRNGFFKAMPSIVIVFLQCISAGLATWCIIKTITFIEPYHLSNVISITALAGAMGLLALFSPAGIGVREGIYLLALSPIIGSEKAALVAILLRLIQTIADLMMAMAGFVILRPFFRIKKNIKMD